MTDEQITKAARAICAAQADKQDNYEVYQRYLIGDYDHTIWMRLVEQGIRRGLEGQAMVKTQHCPNCEATEQKLHDFQQEVSDAVEEYYSRPYDFPAISQSFIIPKPKPDPLVEIMEDYGWYGSPTAADNLRAALDARGLEIREKGQ
jgi:hypothetical protein